MARARRIILYSILSVLLSCQIAFPVRAGETGGDPNEANLLDLLGEGLAYYIPGDACSGEIPPSGAATADGHTLPASTGGTGFEEPINGQGQVPSTGGHVTFAGSVQNASTIPIPEEPEGRSQQDLYRQYYITMRWRYVLWNWDGSPSTPGPEQVDYYSKAPKILVTNKRTGKSIIAVVLEAGPAPWTGVDDNSNNTPKQGWANPQDRTPTTYKGRVSGFPPRAIADLGATMRMTDGSGDDLIYQWAPDQNALPGPTTNAAAGAATSDATLCPGLNGIGNVNTQGFSWPVGDQLKHSYGTAPCPKRACHHDGTPAFDLMYGPDGNMDGKPVYAITAGTIQNVNIYHGVEGCYSIQFKSDKTFQDLPGKNYYYWYGHLQNPSVSPGQHVEPGEQIAEVGRISLGSDCRGGRDHLHIDRGCVIGDTPQTGGRQSCRDDAFVPVINSMWNELPGSAPSPGGPAFE